MIFLMVVGYILVGISVVALAITLILVVYMLICEAIYLIKERWNRKK